MRYVLFIAGPGFVSVATYATYKAAEAAYYAAVAKISYRCCAADAVVLMKRSGRVIMSMG